ncbi:MAG: MerR family transcriptional regulator [Deltaproteobacteria bacterium]|nr:MerR family transcriptional regulator [Deltaproteobacteria bacterium]
MAGTGLPSKLFFRIGEVAGLVGVEPHVLRYWEREFRSIRPTKSAKGQRVYSRKDVENLLRVRDLLYRDGFTIAGAKKRLLQRPDGEAMPSAVPAPDTTPEPFDDPPSGPLEEVSASSTPEPRSGPAPTTIRNKLEAMRSEVEAFLDELEGDGVARGAVD